MKNAITTKPQAKTIVSALRRELKALDKSTQALTHNDCLAVMAKALGFPSWNAWEAALAEGEDQSSVTKAAPASDRPKYPLVNEGQFDFVEPGEDGEPFDGLTFNRLEGTSDLIPATACVNFVSRGTPDNPADETGLHIEHAGESNVGWDEQEVKEKDGFQLWFVEGGGETPQARLVIAPEGHSDIYNDEDLPVREKLIEAFIEYYSTNGLDAKAKAGNFDTAEMVIGFGLTNREEEVLANKLSGVLTETIPLF